MSAHSDAPESRDRRDEVAGAAAGLEALGIAWPAGGEFLRALVRIRTLVSAWSTMLDRAGDVEPGDVRAAARYRADHAGELTTARAVFAAANGWCVARSPFTADQLRSGRISRRPAEWQGPSWGEELAVRPWHLDFFRTRRQRPVALVVHVSGRETPAAIAGLAIARVPLSWYAPRGAAAYLILPSGKETP